MTSEKPLNVLVIDDEVDFATVLGKRLAKRGLSVRTANNGKQGLRALAEQSADIVVLDMRMPGMDGVATFHAIKELDPDIEVIFLTGHADADSALTGLKLGAFDYCLKPMDLDTLHDKILDAAERKRLAERIP